VHREFVGHATTFLVSLRQQRPHSWYGSASCGGLGKVTEFNVKAGQLMLKSIDDARPVASFAL
jgi:hypothetical protein